MAWINVTKLDFFGGGQHREVGEIAVNTDLALTISPREVQGLGTTSTITMLGGTGSTSIAAKQGPDEILTLIAAANGANQN